MAVVQLFFVTPICEKPRSAAISDALVISFSYNNELSYGSDVMYVLIWLFD